MSGVELIRDFVNTFHVEEQLDDLAEPADLTGWLADHGLLPASAAATRSDLRAARALREALRTLLLANNGIEVDAPAAAAALDRAAATARVELRFGADGAVLEPRAAGVPGALGRLLAAVHGAMADGSWPRLKACRAGDCHWAFVDNARNRSRAWCSMRVCGNREKVRSHRARRRAS